MVNDPDPATPTDHEPDEGHRAEPPSGTVPSPRQAEADAAEPPHAGAATDTETVDNKSRDPDSDPEDGDEPEAETFTYAFEEDDVAVAAALIDEASKDASAPAYTLVTSITDAAATAGVRLPLRRQLTFLFHYRLNVERGTVNPTPGTSLEPVETDANHFMPGIKSTTDDVAALWERLSDTVTTDRSLAHLHDLLFIRRHGNVQQHGDAAIAHYRTAAETAAEHDQVLMLLRAWTIARRMRRHDQETEVRAAMWNILRDHADRSDGGAPGVTMPLLTALSVTPSKPTATAEPDLDATLDDLATKYHADHLVDRIAAMQRKRHTGDQAALDKINRRRVQARLDRADAATMVQLRMHFLEQAAALARSLGINDLADHAVTEMQNIDPTSLEWMHISASAPAPVEAYEALLAQFDQTGEWDVGLFEWFATAPPSGNYRDNVRAARERAGNSILRRIFGAKSYGAHGLPQQSSGSDEALDDDVRQYERTHAGTLGELLAIGLHRIRALNPDLTATDLTEWILDVYGGDYALVSRLARSMVLFWDSKYDEAAHTVVPAVETATRSLLRELDEPLYRVEKSKTIGQFPPLGAMLPKLHARGLDKSWHRYLEVMLLPEGSNLRNVIAHGLTNAVGPVDAALLIRAAAVLVLIAAPDGTRRDAAEVAAALKSPTTPARRTFRQRVRAAIRAARWELRRH